MLGHTRRHVTAPTADLAGPGAGDVSGHPRLALTFQPCHVAVHGLAHGAGQAVALVAGHGRYSVEQGRNRCVVLTHSRGTQRRLVAEHGRHDSVALTNLAGG